MAIPFLNNINLSDNEIQNVKLHVTGTAPTAATGQIYYDSSLNVARYYDNDGWVRLTDTSLTSGTFVSATPSGTNAEKSYAVELSATGTPSTSTFLRGDNTWATVVQENDFLTGLSFNTNDGVLTATVQNQSDVTVNLDGRYALASDIPATIVESVTGGTYITNSGTAADVVLDHDATSRTDTTSTDAPAYGGTFEAVTSVTTNATGHVTAIDVSTVTIPASDDTTYTLSAVDGPSNDADIVLTPSSGVADLVTIQGVLNETTVDASGDTITIGLPDDVTIAGELTVSGTGQSSFSGQVTIPQTPSADTDAASKHYVDQAVTGALSYQGGYNASTNTPDLTTSPNSIKKGWTYTVTADGTFFGEQLRVGDVLIAEIDNPTSLADWTSVQNNIDLASASQVGIGNVADGTGISVSYSDGTATVTNTDTNSSNTYATTITDTNTITHGLNTRDVIIQLYDATTYETVYADVERISTTQSTITFASTPTNSVRVLVQKIG